MMWIVYNPSSAEIYKKCYSKQAAKRYMQLAIFPLNSNPAIDKIDLNRIDEWRMWTLLKA